YGGRGPDLGLSLGQQGPEEFPLLVGQVAGIRLPCVHARIIGPRSIRKRPLRNVEKDIEKFRQEIRYRREHCDPCERIRGHVLVWGVYRPEKGEDHPIKFFDSVGDVVELHTLRWLPLEWASPKRAELTNRAMSIPIISGAFWIGLAEVVKI